MGDVRVDAVLHFNKDLEANIYVGVSNLRGLGTQQCSGRELHLDVHT